MKLPYKIEMIEIAITHCLTNNLGLFFRYGRNCKYTNTESTDVIAITRKCSQCSLSYKPILSTVSFFSSGVSAITVTTNSVIINTCQAFRVKGRTQPLSIAITDANMSISVNI